MQDNAQREAPFTYWTVSWNYIDGDCGSLPGTHLTEEDAIAYGEAWADEANHKESIEEDPLEATYWVFRHEVNEDGTKRVFDDEGKLVQHDDGTE